VQSSGLITLVSCAVERDARSGRGPEFNPSRGPVRRVRLRKSNYLKEKNSYAHDDQGDNPWQATEGSTVSSVTVAGILISSVKVLAALTSTEADRRGRDR